MKGLSDLSARHALGEVSGRGLLVALDLKQDIASKITEHALGTGLLLNAPRPNLLRFMPALNVSEAEIDKMFAALGDTLRQTILA